MKNGIILFSLMKSGIVSTAFLVSVGALASGTSEKSATIVSGKIVWGSKITSEQKKLNPSAALYVFAKRGQAGPPVAVKRFTPPFNFPLSFELTSDDVMIKGTESGGEMKLTARISQSGSAMPTSKGDIEGVTSKPFKSGTKNVEVVLDTVK